MSTTTTTTTTNTTLVPTGTWVIDPGHSSVGFQVKHMGIATVRGVFNAFEGRLELGEDGSVKATGAVDVASVDTNEDQRDQHLRSADFFDVERFPQMAFESKEIRALDDDEFEVTGDLTMHGVTREITLKAEVQGTDVDPWGNERVGIEASGTISRADFDMRFNQALGSGNMLVADKVKLLLDVSAVKQA